MVAYDIGNHRSFRVQSGDHPEYQVEAEELQKDNKEASKRTGLVIKRGAWTAKSRTCHRT